MRATSRKRSPIRKIVKQLALPVIANKVMRRLAVAPWAQGALPLTSIELFTGAGGLALATREAGFAHAALIERNHDACETLRTNIAGRHMPGIHRWTVLETDVREVAFRDFGKVELIAGGPPCQPFSIAGKHRGTGDSRNMVPEFIRAVRELQPRAFILENVRGLTRPMFRAYFEHIILQLSFPEIQRKPGEEMAEHLYRLKAIQAGGRRQGLTYRVSFRVLNAADFGVPQTRHRVFVVGFRSDVECDWEFPEPTHSLEALISDQWITGAYWERHGVRKPKTPASIAGRVRKLRREGKPSTLPWRTIRDAVSDLPEPCVDRDVSRVLNHRLQPGARPYQGHTGSPFDLPSKTLKAGDHGVPGGENAIRFPDGRMRYLTVREAARIQTFPDQWEFRGVWSEAMRQLGNAVPVRLASVVATSVASWLSGDAQS
jgi:DNA (cytosine-5)-methyltransferase 1